MVIAINTRFILPNYMEGYGNYTYEIFSRVALHQPTHQFIFIFDRPFNKKLELPQNCTPVVVVPAARHPLLWHYWYNVKIPMVLRKYKANLFISPDGFCSLSTRVKQITIIHDLAFLIHPEAIRKSHLFYYKKFTQKFIKKSEHIITVSSFTKNHLIDTYQTPDHKISIVYNAANEIFKPLYWQVLQEVKQRYTNGLEYFLCTSSIHPRKNIINLLKAFSIFKKWQHSNMKLILVGRLAWKNESFEKLLATYKYKNDVVQLGYIKKQELAQLTAAAYCVVYPSLFEGFGVPIIEAMQAEVPVITSNNSGMLEAGGAAALYADPSNINEIAAQMQLIYKDESLRAKHINLGKQHVKQFSWDKSAEQIWHIIDDTVKLK
jgi:glycosyltransferase involved in cell wall biosynthesis